MGWVNDDDDEEEEGDDDDDGRDRSKGVCSPFADMWSFLLFGGRFVFPGKLCAVIITICMFIFTQVLFLPSQ